MTFKKNNRGKGNCSASIFYKLKISAKIDTKSVPSKQKPITSLAKIIFLPKNLQRSEILSIFAIPNL